jgi:long-chain acyl-CoA synthetase
MTTLPQTLGQLFLEGIAQDNPRALRIAVDGQERTLSAAQVSAQVLRVALALRRAGLAKGEAVALLSENRPEWLIADFGITLSGGVVIPLYMNLLPPQVRCILADAKPRFVLVSTPDQARKVREATEPSSPQVILMDPPPGSELPHAWDRFLASGAPREGDPDLPALAAAQQPEDLASILYTSGTTGEPKGVCLTHRNLTAATAVIPLLGAEPGKEQVLSFLPLAHIFGRVVDLGFFGSGASIAYAPSLDHLPEEMKRYRPTVFAAVPRVFEKAYAAIQGRIATSPPWRKQLAHLCIAAALRRQAGKASTWDALRVALGDRLIFRRIREGMGGRLRIVISGGAPLTMDILRFFWAVGIPLYEGYGLTEAGVLCVNLPGRTRLGSVGPSLPGVEILTGKDGEVLARGPVVMRGFHKASLTAEAIDAQGWLHTGDLGRIEDGYLCITGRKKELMKTAGGKYIAPAALEQRLLTLSCVSQAMAVADGRPYPAALVVPDPAGLRRALVDQGLGEAPAEVLCADPRALAYVEAEVEKAMEDLPRYERVKRVALLPAPFTVEAGELTPTLKMKRAFILLSYATRVEALYARP